MSDAQVFSPGVEKNYVAGSASTSSAKKLFLELFGGEVMHAFNQAQVTMNRHMVRTIPNGKSARFPATGKTSATTHTPGAEILGQEFKHAERVISIDDLLISSVFVDVLDEAMNHYPIRAEYSKQIGEALANTMDQHVLQCMTLAANTASTVQDLDGGSVLGFSSANSITGNYELLIDAIYGSLRELDDKNVPSGSRQVFLNPLAYYSLLRDPTVGTSTPNYWQRRSPIGTIMSRDAGGSGSIQSAQVPQIGGADIIKTNNLLQSAITGTPGDKYNVDQSDTVALVNTPASVGTVKLMGLSIESSYDPRRLGSLVVGKYAVGHGVLRPECAVEITDAASNSLTPAKSADGNRP